MPSPKKPRYACPTYCSDLTAESRHVKPCRRFLSSRAKLSCHPERSEGSPSITVAHQTVPPREPHSAPHQFTKLMEGKRGFGGYEGWDPQERESRRAGTVGAAASRHLERSERSLSITAAHQTAPQRKPRSGTAPPQPGTR